MDSILTSVKKTLGIEEDYTHFDPVLVLHINTVFMVLTQMGVGPSEGFSITDSSAVWTDFIPEGVNLEAVKTYMGLKVQTIFDPPTNGTIMNSTTNLINELEWRLHLEGNQSDNQEV